VPVNVYFNFNGNCKEALEYYAEVFGQENLKFQIWDILKIQFFVPDDMRIGYACTS
jgi:uncharacterized glyoxalase superfamily protein PhnB